MWRRLGGVDVDELAPSQEDLCGSISSRNHLHLVGSWFVEAVDPAGALGMQRVGANPSKWRSYEENAFEARAKGSEESGSRIQVQQALSPSSGMR